jgi:prevent-host-death family protein
MNVLSLTEIKAKFSEIVEQVISGEEIIITKMGKPVARISRYESAQQNCRLGCMQGQATLPDDFDEWPEEEARALGIID